jgi:hypothetical protein
MRPDTLRGADLVTTFCVTYRRLSAPVKPGTFPAHSVSPECVMGIDAQIKALQHRSACDLMSVSDGVHDHYLTTIY